MGNQQSGGRRGLGVLGVLQIIFIVLKVTNLITWSWWLVLLPIWISIGGWILLLVVLGIIAVVAFALDSRKGTWHQRGPRR